MKNFKDNLNKLKIKIFAPSTVCYRLFGKSSYELRYFACIVTGKQIGRAHV